MSFYNGGGDVVTSRQKAANGRVCGKSFVIVEKLLQLLRSK